MKPVRVIFKPNDTLFFRESRPMEAHGSKPLGGLFPPPATTVAGAVRAMIGEYLNVNWIEYRGNKSSEAIYDAIGKPDDESPGPLKLVGPFPTKSGNRLYPVPAHLLYQEGNEAENKAPDYRLLNKLSPLECDLGLVDLPASDAQLNGAKPLDNAWLTKENLIKVLSCKCPDSHITTEKADGNNEWLLSSEPRLGIAIDQNTRVAEESKLYQTVHARLSDDVAVGVEVYPPDGHDHFHKIKSSNPTVRLGGEGRFSSVAIGESDSQIIVPNQDGNLKVLLMLLTPALVNMHSEDCSVNNVIESIFNIQTNNMGVSHQSTKVWETAFKLDEEIFKIKIRSAAMGKAIRLGGWNLKEHQSRQVKSFVPAGSVFYCEVDKENFVTAFNHHNQTIGLQHKLGYGELVAGYWG